MPIMNRAKEIYNLSKCLAELTDGQAELQDYDPDVVDTLIIKLSPNGGLYQGGSYTFQIDLDEWYPSEPPVIRCVSGIYHPNIDSWQDNLHTNVCLNILEDSLWCEGFGLKGCVIGLLYLLHHPNFDDAINPEFVYRGNLQEYEKDIKLSLQGKPVGFLRQTMDDIFNVLIPSASKAPEETSEDASEHCVKRAQPSGSAESTAEAEVPEVKLASWNETNVSQPILDERNADPENMDHVSANKDIVMRNEANCACRRTETSDISLDDTNKLRSIQDEDSLFEDRLIKQDIHCNNDGADHCRKEETVAYTQDLHLNRDQSEYKEDNSLTDVTEPIGAPGDAMETHARDTSNALTDVTEPIGAPGDAMKTHARDTSNALTDVTEPIGAPGDAMKTHARDTSNALTDVTEPIGAPGDAMETHARDTCNSLTESIGARDDAMETHARDTAEVIDFDELLYQHFMDNFDD